LIRWAKVPRRLGIICATKLADGLKSRTERV